MNKKKIFLHIGYPKTASTTMQQFISLKIKGLKCFIPNVSHEYLNSTNDKKLFEENYLIKDLVENFIIEDYDSSKPLALLRQTKDNIFISTTGPLSAFFFKGRYVRRNKHIKPEQIAKRVFEVFGAEFDVKVIITIRKQVDWIPSAYAEWHQYFSKIKKYNSIEKFASSFKDLNYGFAQNINFTNVVAPFEKTLGMNNIYISVFEQFKYDPINYYKGLIDYMGGEIDEKILENIPKLNVRETSGNLKKIDNLTLSKLIFFFKLRHFPNLSLGMIKRFPNVLKLLSKVKWPSNNQRVKIKLSKEDKQDIFNVYQAENMSFSKYYDLNLEDYEYF
jgi:hypothetical protein